MRPTRRYCASTMEYRAAPAVKYLCGVYGFYYIFIYTGSRLPFWLFGFTFSGPGRESSPSTAPTPAEEAGAIQERGPARRPPRALSNSNWRRVQYYEVHVLQYKSVWRLHVPKCMVSGASKKKDKCKWPPKSESERETGCSSAADLCVCQFSR